MMLIQNSVNSDWLFNNQSRVLKADWFILETKKATLIINKPNGACYCSKLPSH